MPSGQQDRTLVAGVDSSTQSTKVVVCDAATGEVLREGRAAHPEGTEVHPDRWWDAYREATAGGLLDGVAAVGVGGQQHGMVALDEAGDVVRPALLWNDVRSAQAASATWSPSSAAPRRGPTRSGWCRWPASPSPSSRWLAEHEPRPRRPGGRGGAPARLADREDPRRRHPGPRAYVDRPRRRLRHRLLVPGHREYREDLLELAFGRVVRTPRVARPRRARRASPTRGCWSPPAPATTWPPASGSAWSPATSWSRWAPAAPCSACTPDPPPTPPARSPASRTPPDGSCRWSAPSTPRGCSAPPRACSAPTWPVWSGSPSRPGTAPAG